VPIKSSPFFKILQIKKDNEIRRDGNDSSDLEDTKTYINSSEFDSNDCFFTRVIINIDTIIGKMDRIMNIDTIIENMDTISRNMDEFSWNE